MVSQRITTVDDGLSLGQWQVHLGACWHWLYQTWGKLLAASHRSHPYSPPATKALPCKASTMRKTDQAKLLRTAEHIFIVFLQNEL